jgi:hypothetical protein
MDTLRSKNDFAFESDDSNLPYMVEKILVGTQRVAAFNYSSEYFRKKKSSDKGMYRIIGGNIPSDMSSSHGFTFEEGSLSCDLNKGTGKPDKPLPVLNLTPNRIFDTAAYHCQPANTIVRGPTLPPISKEAGKDQKANHMYIPVYQHSCSDHPRAKGFAHEDSYSCLHRFNSQSSLGWRKQKFKCESGAGCMEGVKFVKKNEDGTLSDGAAAGFSCLTTDWQDPFLRNVACGEGNKPVCKAGYMHFEANPSSCKETKPWSPPGNCPAAPNGYILYSMTIYTIFSFSWPRENCDNGKMGPTADCDCLDGSIQVTENGKCTVCKYEKCTSKDSTGGYSTYSCDGGGGSTEFCGCAFQKEESYGFFTTFEDVNYPFPNWSRLGFVGKTVGVLPCRGLELTCDDVI